MDLSSWCLAFSGKGITCSGPKALRLFRVIPLLIVQIEKVFIVNLADCLGPDNQISAICFRLKTLVHMHLLVWIKLEILLKFTAGIETIVSLA